jgi:acetyl-CoA acyltransferase 1
MLTKAAREVLRKSPHDVVVLSAVRSPITRAFKGGFKDLWPEEILMPVCVEHQLGKGRKDRS